MRKKTYYAVKINKENIVAETDKAWGLAMFTNEKDIWWVPKSQSHIAVNNYQPGFDYFLFVKPWLIKKMPFFQNNSDILLELGYWIRALVGASFDDVQFENQEIVPPDKKTYVISSDGEKMEVPEIWSSYKSK